jgi:hypothetical protein
MKKNPFINAYFHKNNPMKVDLPGLGNNEYAPCMLNYVVTDDGVVTLTFLDATGRPVITVNTQACETAEEVDRFFPPGEARLPIEFGNE